MRLPEGLEVLGTNEKREDGRPYFGVFEETTIEGVVLPSTLRKIEYNTFKKCKSLANV